MVRHILSHYIRQIPLAPKGLKSLGYDAASSDGQLLASQGSLLTQSRAT